MPFIPVETMARAGLQPFASIATYKNTYANGDFAGFDPHHVRAEPRHAVAFVMVEDENGGDNRGTRASLRSGAAPVSLAAVTTSRSSSAPSSRRSRGSTSSRCTRSFYAEGTTSG